MTDNMDNIENIENIESIENIENVENIENIENVAKIEKIEKSENITGKDGQKTVETIDLETPEGRMAFIESVLFVSKDPVKPERLIDFLNLSGVRELDRVITAMEESYRSVGRGIFIKRSGGGLQLVTRPAMHLPLKEFFSVKSSSRLSVASLETLAIIAYRQPVTLAEIADLRGVNSTGPAKTLLQKKLVRISGRKKVPGLPALYSTTKEFLLYFGLNNLKELPSLEELTEMFEEKEQPSLFAV